MPELVAKTASAIAVDENLTTLIDWVNIEAVSGFTIIVDNAGGGSVSDINDVQIDTSDDGGVTPNLDQHPGIPDVPIDPTNASMGTFTETAKFVRVRAKCGASEDTTAEAILLADSSTGRICTLADVKERLGFSNTDHDQAIHRIITGLESIFNGFTRRYLIVNAAETTEYYSVVGRFLQLARYPVVSITSIKQALDYDFDSADALTVNDDYRLLASGDKGIITRVNMSWFDVSDCIQVIYKGGYSPAGQTPGTGETAMPADLREAAIEQASFFFKRRDDIGLSGVGHQGGSISKFSSINLLPMVKEILNQYRRPSL